jgi:dTDP-4-dehydrorhamnose reductase
MILCTGANGMLGSYINWPHTFKTDIYDLDVSNEKDVARYNKFNASCIVHLAAETDLEKCEKNAEHAYWVNVIGTTNMVEFAQRKDIPIIYISTAGVFDGTKETPYTEEDKPNPINIYGLTKWYGELVVQKYPKHYIFRAGWMMGGVEKDKKFISKIIKLLGTLPKEINVIDDAFGSPTYASDLCDVIRGAIDIKIPYGLYHACGGGKASRYDVACEIVRIMKHKVKVNPVSYNDYKDKIHTCIRSTNETMSTEKLEKAGLYMRNWKSALKDYMREWR